MTMIAFGPMSITLLICAAQGAGVAILLWRSAGNRAANRYLALLILAFVALIAPYIIGFAGFYDRWPWLSFAPFSYTMAFGPLVWLYTRSLIDGATRRAWVHFAPVGLQFLSQALVFPLPLATKNWWDALAQAPIISPLFEVATLLSLALYGAAAFSQYRAYRRWLNGNRADAMEFDPRWIRNFLFAMLGVGCVWAGFLIADALDPRRDYFDHFWLYVVFAILVIGLGFEGWRHANIRFPLPSPDGVAVTELPQRDWTTIAKGWIECLDREQYWRDPEITLASLARALGTNTVYLSRAFNAGLGENFNAVINRLRVAEVQRRLRNPAETRDVLTIALEAGFGSKASFNRAFIDFTGQTPSAWRRKS
jgi:AraC-like DNA-binding protein